MTIWDTFSHTEGKVANNDNGDVACDHYHRYKEDVELLKSLGIKNYRYSIAWARIFPKGTGEINPKGLEFYNNLTNALIEAGIEPYVTLYHWVSFFFLGSHHYSFVFVFLGGKEGGRVRLIDFLVLCLSGRVDWS